MVNRSRGWRATRPAEPAPIEESPQPSEPSEFDRRARAFDRVYPLLSTSIPTAEIMHRYRAEIATR